METPDAVPLVKSGALDLLVGYRYLPGDAPLMSDSLAVTMVRRESMLLVAAPEEGLTFEKLVGRDWALGHRLLGDRRLLHHWSDQLRFRFHVAFESSDTNCLLTLASEGLAVTWSPPRSSPRRSSAAYVCRSCPLLRESDRGTGRSWS